MDYRYVSLGLTIMSLTIMSAITGKWDIAAAGICGKAIAVLFPNLCSEYRGIGLRKKTQTLITLFLFLSIDFMITTYLKTLPDQMLRHVYGQVTLGLLVFILSVIVDIFPPSKKWKIPSLSDSVKNLVAKVERIYTPPTRAPIANSQRFS